MKSLLLVLIVFPVAVVNGQETLSIEVRRDSPEKSRNAPLDAPYPPSPVIASVNFDFSTIKSFGPGSDQWPMTWASDGHLYAGWGDGWGWERKEEDRKQSIGVTRILGDAPKLKGEDLWGDGPGSGFGKPEALVDLNGTLYMFWTRGDSTKDSDNTATAISHDQGRTWSYGNGKAFPQAPDGFRVRGICQFGSGYENARDSYVYVYFGFNRASDLFLARVPNDSLFSPKKYEWFTGLNANRQDAIWSNDIAKRQPVFHDPGGYVWHIGVCHNPGLNRYLLSKPHYLPDDNRQAPQVRDSGVAAFGLFDAPNPWGPWTSIYYKDNFKDALVKFSYFIPTKFLSDNGQDFWLAWSGWPEYDNVNFVKGHLQLKTPQSPVRDPAAQ